MAQRGGLSNRNQINYINNTNLIQQTNEPVVQQQNFNEFPQQMNPVQAENNPVVTQNDDAYYNVGIDNAEPMQVQEYNVVVEDAAVFEDNSASAIATRGNSSSESEEDQITLNITAPTVSLGTSNSTSAKRAENAHYNDSHKRGWFARIFKKTRRRKASYSCYF